MLKHILFTCFLFFTAIPLLKAQGCGNDEKYHLPYKNTYVKEPLVAENEYRIAKPETVEPKSSKKPGRFFLILFGPDTKRNLKCIGEHGK